MINGNTVLSSAEVRQESDALLHYLNESPTAWQATAGLVQRLEKMGAKPFSNWQAQGTKLQAGDCGYFKQNDSALMVFSVGQDPMGQGFRLFGAHTDSPALKIKPNALTVKEGVWCLNTEVYGGPLLGTWFDRPLSLAGRVVLKSEDPLNPAVQLIDFHEPILILPNVAIHMNRQANDGVKIERQKVLYPFLGLVGEEKKDPRLFMKELVAHKLQVHPDRILDYDLMTYEAQPACYCGLQEEFISAGRLDNLEMAWAGYSALASAREQGRGIQILILTDNEEVGSTSKQGAASLWVRDCLERIILQLGGDRQDFFAVLDRSFMISADLAHAVHPNYLEYADPDHRPMLNQGPVIKSAASQSYASDAHSASVFISLAEKAGVPCQRFVNRSDQRGGSTIGPITSSLIPIPTVDCGNAIWGMHSCRETGGALDPWYMKRLLETFFTL